MNWSLKSHYCKSTVSNWTGLIHFYLKYHRTPTTRASSYDYGSIFFDSWQINRSSLQFVLTSHHNTAVFSHYWIYKAVHWNVLSLLSIWDTLNATSPVSGTLLSAHPNQYNYLGSHHEWTSYANNTCSFCYWISQFLVFLTFHIEFQTVWKPLHHFRHTVLNLDSSLLTLWPILLTFHNHSFYWLLVELLSANFCGFLFAYWFLSFS